MSKLKKIVPFFFLIGISVIVLAQQKESDSKSLDSPEAECNFQVTPQHGSDSQQLDQDLTLKLHQIDLCLQMPPRATGKGNGSGNYGSGNDDGDDLEGQGNSSFADAESEGEESDESLDSPINASNLDADNQTIASSSNSRDANSRVGPRKFGAKEDDVAKLLREAAEKEQDPTRKASLIQNYEDYMAGKKR